MEKNMKLDSTGYYRMPLIMGPLWRGKIPQFSYPQTEVIALQYLTETDAIASLLPDCFKPGKEPIVTVLFGYYNGLYFMAGGGYSVAAVQVSARFDGNKIIWKVTTSLLCLRMKHGPYWVDGKI
jgi:hypothetical protein